MTSIAKYIGAGCLAGLCVAAFAGQAVQQLLIDGKVVSTQVTQTNGRYEVPIDDVAKFFGYTMNIAGGQATLTRTTPQATAGTASGDSGVLASQTSDPTMTTTGSGTATNTNNLYSTQQQPATPVNIQVNQGSSASVNGFDYTVISIKDAGPTYKDMFDQRGRSLHPKWKTDALVVINIDVTNRGTSPVQALVPGSADITVFDSKKLGYQATGLDERQTPDVVTSGLDDYSSSLDGGTSNLLLGPGGTVHFAAIASVPIGDRVTSVMIRVNGNASSGNSMGAIITVNR